MNTLINSSNCIVLGNTSSGTALTVQQLGSGSIAAFQTAAGVTTVSVNAAGQLVPTGAGGVATNTAVGTGAMNANTTGFYNTAVGTTAMQNNTTGAYNTAVGTNAMQANTTGQGNTAVGANAGINVTTGANNIIIGLNAANSGANNLTTGSSNILIGASCGSSSSTVSNEVTINSGINIARFQGSATSWTFSSDGRDKTNVSGIPVGLDFIKTLRPVSYQWDHRDWYENKQPDGSKKNEVISIGFIAQELDAAVQASEHANCLNYLVYKNDPENLMISETNLIPILVKAIQELEQSLATVTANISSLQPPSAPANPQSSP